MNLPTEIIFLNRITFTDKLFFTKHLSVMIRSGVSLAEAVKALRDQTRNPAFKKILNSILTDIENGQTLKKALSRHPHLFDPVYISLVSIGEESGNLESNLEYLADQLKRNYELQKKIQGAMIYPAIVLTTATVVGGAISFFVLPKMIDLFQSLEVDLPLTTKILLFLANTVKDYGLIIISILIGLAVGGYLLIQTEKVKPKWQTFLLTIPAVGQFLQNVELASFCRNLGIMLKSGLPIAISLNDLHDSTDNLIFKHYIGKIHEAVKGGKSMTDELNSKDYPLIPAIVAKMVGVGEETGKLDESMLYLGHFFEEEVEDSSKNLSNVLEPILLLIIAGVVAFVALAIITPIYQFTGSIR